MASFANTFLNKLAARHPGETAFHRAVADVVDCVSPLVLRNAAFRECKVLERLVEPERLITFRVPWRDDRMRVHVQRAHRVQMNGALGPYKGGLRFHPSVTVGGLKALAFEQVLKNSLTQLSLGGAKGGSDFEPKGKSDAEIARFCEAFMSELRRHLGPHHDVPAGDLGVGPRELGYLFGSYRRHTGEWSPVLTGKPLSLGGSASRAEATGYGVVMFAAEMLARRGRGLHALVVTVSGSGNVAQYAAEKLLQEGARVVTLSDSEGTLHDPDGLDEPKLAWILELKNIRRGRLREATTRFPTMRFLPNQRPWSVPCDLALPCAIENELDEKDAIALVAGGCGAVVEGANMPCTHDAIARLREGGVLFAPGKAANAGGVAVSALELAQNSVHASWTRSEVEARLQQRMREIHAVCVEHGREEGAVDYVRGANIASFLRVANAMVAEGIP